MIQRFAPWLGTGMLVLVATFLAGFGLEVLTDPTMGVTMAGFVVAALLMIVGGTVESISIGSRSIPWNVLVGASYVVLALVVALSNVETLATGEADTAATFTALGLLVGCISLGWLGVQTARDSRHVDLEASPSRPRLVGITVLAVASIALGAFLAVSF